MKTPVEIAESYFATIPNLIDRVFRRSMAADIIAALEAAGYVIAHPNQVTVEPTRKGYEDGIAFAADMLRKSIPQIRQGLFSSFVSDREALLIAADALDAAARELRAAPKWSKGSEG